jgi:peptidyl-tRNA hydrolase
MVEYDSAQIYIDSKTTIRAKITAIDAVIDALMTTALKAAGTDNITEYSLDDGQTKIRTMYKGADSVLASVQAFEKIKQMYINRLNGRMTRLVDGRNFI